VTHGCLLYNCKKNCHVEIYEKQRKYYGNKQWREKARLKCDANTSTSGVPHGEKSGRCKFGR